MTTTVTDLWIACKFYSLKVYRKKTNVNTLELGIFQSEVEALYRSWHQLSQFLVATRGDFVLFLMKKMMTFKSI